METNYTENENEEFKKIAPHLFKIEKKEVFTTPENYFENLPGLLQDRVNEKAKTNAVFVPRYRMALVVASVSLLIFVGIKFYTSQPKETIEIASTEMAQNYDNQYLASADETELAEQLDDETLDNALVQMDKTTGASSDEITDYLMNDNIDLTTITNEF
jgi:hypothetical protein